MTGWIILAIVAVAAVLLWKGMRTMWKESSAKVDSLPPASARRTWPVPHDAGDRIMWCPILAKKVILADTEIDEGEVGTVVGFTDDKRHPIISFASRATEPHTVDKWAAARVLPGEFERPRNNAPPPRTKARARAKSKSTRHAKKRR